MGNYCGCFSGVFEGTTDMLPAVSSDVNHVATHASPWVYIDDVSERTLTPPQPESLSTIYEWDDADQLIDI